MRTTPAWVLLVALWPALATGQDWRTLSRGREYTGERSLKVDVEYGAGRLLIGPAASSVLYRASLRYDADIFTPNMKFADGTLHVGMGDGNIKGRRDMKGGQLDLRLGSEVPLDIELKFGAAEAQLELGGLQVRNLQVSTGASATTLGFSRPNPGTCERADFEVGAARFEVIGLGNLNARRLDVSGGVGEVVLDFTGAWRSDLEAKVNMGLGALTLRVPKGLGVRIARDGLLSGFDSEGLIKRGKVYYSEGYEQAKRKLGVELDAAFGAIKVVWVDAG